MYKSQLMTGYKRYFDLVEAVEKNGFKFDFCAKFNSRNAKYLGIKKLEYYAFSNFEEVYYKHFEDFNQNAYGQVTQFIQNYLDQFSPSDETHMETLLTLIVSSGNPVSPELKNTFLKTNPQKSIKWGFKGWIKVKLILIDANNQISTNKFGRPDQKKLLKLIS